MKYAFYAFVNFRMIGIHAGIQGGHAAGELMTTQNKKRFNEYQNRIAQEWLDVHKTFVFLHAGQSADLRQAYEKFSAILPYPCVMFREEPEAFGDNSQSLGAVTAWGVVLPESVYSARKSIVSPLTKYVGQVAYPDRTEEVVWEYMEHPEVEFLEYKAPMRLAY